MILRQKRLTGLRIASFVAILFGLLTIFSGGRVLFGGLEARTAAGDAVPFVLWFNFMAGFAYVAAGVGLALGHRCAVWLSIAILSSTFLVLLAFGLHVTQGGVFEMRTVGAMILRTVVWVGIVILALKVFAGR